jgi:hypothetical protein
MKDAPRGYVNMGDEAFCATVNTSWNHNTGKFTGFSAEIYHCKQIESIQYCTIDGELIIRFINEHPAFYVFRTENELNDFLEEIIIKYGGEKNEKQ